MQVKYTIVIKGRTHYYADLLEAQKMARFVGFPVASIKEVHIW